MAVTWGDYTPYVPVVSRPLHEVTRREARAEFKHLMAAKDDRIAELRRLLGLNGVELSSSGDTELRRLNDWFRKTVERDRRTGFGVIEPFQELLDSPGWHGVLQRTGEAPGDLATLMGNQAKMGPRMNPVTGQLSGRDGKRPVVADDDLETLVRA